LESPVSVSSETDLKIRVVPTVRESDGLAMSSRNQLLSPEQRSEAGIIPNTLKKAAAMIPGGNFQLVRKYVTETINAHPLAELEYFEIIDAGDLKTLDTWTGMNEPVACIAVRFGSVN